MKKLVPLTDSNPENINRLADDIYDNISEVEGKLLTTGNFSKQEFYEATDADKILMLAKFLNIY